MKWLCLIPLCAQAQALPPVGFEWDAPASLSNALGYRLEWSSGEYAALSLNSLSYQVDGFPVTLNQPVSISTIGPAQSSQPSTIHVYNIEVLVEESTDLAIWQTIGSVSLRGQRKPISFLRLKLNQPAGNQGGD